MTATAIDLDHVAIATRDIVAAIDVAVAGLGGFVVHGGDGYGFRWVQTRLGSSSAGMTVELLVVWEPETNDFLARFLDRHGPGVHHITFKVPDLAEMLERAADLGLHPVGVNLENPQWREAFVQPREAHGTVVQLAQTSDDPGFVAELMATAEATGDAVGTPRWWPDPPTRSDAPVRLERIVVGSPDRRAATEFYAGFLGGTVDSDTAAGTDLDWPGGGRIRIVDAPASGVLRLEATGTTTGTVDLSATDVVVSPL